MRAVNGASGRLMRAIQQAFPEHPLVFEHVQSRDWASGLFTGMRHEITFRLSGLGAEDAAIMFAGDLAERAFDLHGHILADIACVSAETSTACARLTIEALTVDES